MITVTVTAGEVASRNGNVATETDTGDDAAGVPIAYDGTRVGAAREKSIERSSRRVRPAAADRQGPEISDSRRRGSSTRSRREGS